MLNKPILTIVTLMLVACNPVRIDTKAEGEKLMQLSREWSTSARSRELEKTLGYWADDAVVISAGEPTLKGREAIRQMVERSYKNPGFEISWEPLQADISSSGDMGYLLEETRITVKDSTGKAMTRKYNGITVWKKQADGWKNVLDVLSPGPSK